MGPVSIVCVYVIVEGDPELSGAIKFIDVNAIIFDCPENPFCSHVVQGLSLPIHRDFNPVCPKQAQIVWVCEMGSLVTVHDLWPPSPKGALQAGHDKALL